MGFVRNALEFSLALSLLTISRVFGAKVLVSKLTPGVDLWHAGAHLDAQSIPDLEASSSISICVRFNVKVISPFITDYHGRLINVFVRDGDRGGWKEFVRLLSRLPTTILDFGDNVDPRQVKSWFLTEPYDDGDMSTPSEPIHFRAHEWNHFCFAFDAANSSATAIVNGERTNVDGSSYDELSKVTLPESLLDNVYLGMCPHSEIPCSKHAGSFTDFNVWDRALTEAEMVEWTECHPDKLKYGNVVDWRESQWTLTNMTVQENVDYEKVICGSRRPGRIVIPSRMKAVEARRFCGVVGGSVHAVSDQDDQAGMIQAYYEHNTTCKFPRANGMWNGWWDAVYEGNFTKMDRDDVFLTEQEFKPWFPGEPNGQHFENCAIIWPHEDKWNDEGCGNELCFFCDLEEGPEYWLRGLPSSSAFDSRFTWTGQLRNSRYTFQGYTDSELFWDDNLDGWKIRLYSNDSVYLLHERDVSGTRDSAMVGVGEYPFGLGNWSLVVVDGENRTEEDVLLLSLSACNSSEFNCLNGLCVGMDQRCDGRSDCEDRSDETECFTIREDSSYIKWIPPPPLKGKTQTEVHTHIRLDQVVSVSEMDSTVTLQFQLSLTWFDPGLTFLNLKDNSFNNRLSEKAKDLIWLPQLDFNSTAPVVGTENSDRNYVEVAKRGGSTNIKESPWNEYLFQGRENEIRMSQTYTVDFICRFELVSYPFDEQSCQMRFTPREKNIYLKTASLAGSGNGELNEYLLSKVDWVEDDTSHGSDVVVSFVLSRRITSVALTTFVPTALICLLCHSTVYYGEMLFKAVVAVNLTSLLCLITMFNSTSNSLLKTSYVKMIDVWYFATLCVPLTEMLVATWINWLREEINRQPQHTVKVVNKVGMKVNETKVDPGRFQLGGMTFPEDAFKARKLLSNLVWMQRKIMPGVMLLLVFAYFSIGMLTKHT